MRTISYSVGFLSDKGLRKEWKMQGLKTVNLKGFFSVYFSTFQEVSIWTISNIMKDLAWLSSFSSCFVALYSLRNTLGPFPKVYFSFSNYLSIS